MRSGQEHCHKAWPQEKTAKGIPTFHVVKVRMRTTGSLESVCRRLAAIWGCEVLGMQSDRRSLGLQIRGANQVVVRAPLEMLDEDVLHWALERQHWVHQKLNVLRASRRVPVVQPGEGWVWLGGEPAVIRWEPQAPRWQHGLHHNRDSPVSFLIKGPFSREAMSKMLKHRLEHMLMGALKHVLEEAVSALQVQLGNQWSPPQRAIQIRSMRTRWGSCSRHGGMRFASTLVHVPPACLRYVVFHEATHWIHFHHGPSFYELLSKLLPDYKTTETQLGAMGWVWEDGIQLPTNPE